MRFVAKIRKDYPHKVLSIKCLIDSYKKVIIFLLSVQILETQPLES